MIPYDGIGGVETAAKSLPAGIHGGINFGKCFIADKSGTADSPFDHQGPHRSANHIGNYIAAIRFVRSAKPDILIGSLWRSCLVLIFSRLMGVRTKQVLFLHSLNSMHSVDYALNRIAMSLATEVWGDSSATLKSRVPARLLRKTRVISFVIRRIPATPSRPPQPNFIFWGRIDPKKGLSRALKIFAAVRATLPSATFSIVGPDSGYGEILKGLCRELSIVEAVRFLGPKAWDDIQQGASGNSFYLQTSEVEGAAMSVIEAMQLGLVPVVTPVGEIANYCVNGKNAIIVSSDDRAVRDVLELLANPATFEQMANAAQAHWREQPLYRDSILAACSEIMK